MRVFSPIPAGRYAGALAIIALSALVITPFLFQRSIARQRQVYTESLDPARDAASNVRLAVAREVGAIRGYLLTQDTTLLTEYRAARVEQDDALGQLAAVRKADSSMQRQAEGLDEATRVWNVVNDRLVDGALIRTQVTRLMDSQQDKYTAVLDASQTLERSIAVAVKNIRGRVGMLEHQWAVASVALAILAGAAALMVIFMMRMSHQQSELARTDRLTGLHNRLGFDELTARELSRARRNATAITLLNLDIDGFKQVNDERGHAAGDELLRCVANAMRSAIRDIDVGARLGGDEFAVLLADNRADPPERAVERVQRAILGEIARQRWPVTLSVGAVTVYNAQVGIDEMIHHSDKLLYRVKNGGKNAVLHEVLIA
jgi:diguanylate cyclase (GGDEF)-like protein